MQLANQEARRLNHEYIGTEHVLLGLIKEASGVAAYVLRNLDTDLRQIRLEVEKLVPSGRYMVTMGKLPQTPRAKKVIEYSMEEVHNLGHNYFGTEHILLGLLHEKEGVAAHVLTNLGLKLEDVRAEVLAILGQGISASNRVIPDSPRTPRTPKQKKIEAEIERLQRQKEEAIASMDFEKAASLRDQIDGLKKNLRRTLRARIQKLKQRLKSLLGHSQDSAKPVTDVEPQPDVLYSRFTDRARKVMQLADQEAQRFNHEYIGTEHVLLGLVMEGSGVAANALTNLDILLRKIRLEVEKLIQRGPAIVSTRKLRQTPRAKKAIEYAIEEARNLNHKYLGTEHILLGLLRVQDGVAAQVLMSLGLKLEDARSEILKLLGH